MSRYTFLFDFDSTITRAETLPFLATLNGTEKAMAAETEHAMASGCNFEKSFRARAALLRGIPLTAIREKMREMPLNPQIAAFIKAHAGRCLIVTGNLDLWTEATVKALHMTGRCIASQGKAEPDGGTSLLSVLDKTEAIKKIPRPLVAVGDGNNDVGMLQNADIGIAFAGIRPISERLRSAADHVFDTETALCAYLNMLL